MNNSEILFKEAQKYIPGGVNSPVRAFKSVDNNPVYISHARGSRLYDVDGNEYIDYVGSWGPMILGHAEPRIIKKVKEYIDKGTSFGANTENEIKLAKLITKVYPAMDQVRLVNSGTEATMSAVRLARGFTGKDKIIKFEGCYHGHSDFFLIKAGSGVLTLGIPGSQGVTVNNAKDTLIAEYNNIQSVENIIQSNKDQIAALIVEPIMGNAGVIPPQEHFLKELRTLTKENNIVLIFDEVITGFRVALGGAQELYKVKPDLTCLGKIIGGGFPVGAFGGKREIMNYLAPEGPVYQAGTLSGNPIAVAAGIETLDILTNENVYEKLEKKAKIMEKGFKENLKKLNIKYTMNRVGSMSCLFFTDKKINSYADISGCDTKSFAKYFRNMLTSGIYLAPSQFEAAFISTAHSDSDIDKTIKANYNCLKNI